MTEQELKKIAAKKTYSLLIEQGIRIPLPNLIKSTVVSISGKIVVNCLYSDELKAKKNSFLAYFNARIKTDRIYFVYSRQELEIENTAETAANENLEKVMKKINKLLAITEEKGATENEAMIASMKAQQLMKEYNIDYATINGTDKKEKIVNLKYDTPNGLKWKLNLSNHVATSYCCKTFYCGEVITFRGFKSDVLIARRVYAYLLDTAIKLGKEYDKAERKKAAANGESYSSTYTSFCVGFCDGVGKRLGENCKALALKIPQLVEDDWQTYSKDFKTSDIKSVVKNMDAYEQGEIEGKRAVNGQYITSDKKRKTRAAGTLALETKN
ncbi:MAG TPA: hypothetical protein DEP65_13660 [Ruminococcus sp.]|nr:hypothetical protein [Ruminococcus sp.]